MSVAIVATTPNIPATNCCLLLPLSLSMLLLLLMLATTVATATTVVTITSVATVTTVATVTSTDSTDVGTGTVISIANTPALLISLLLLLHREESGLW